MTEPGSKQTSDPRPVKVKAAATFRSAFAVLVALVAASVVMLGGVSSAHTTEQPYLYLFVGSDGLDGRVELAIGDVEEVLGLDLGETDTEMEQTLRSNQTSLRQYLSRHLAIGDGGQEWLVNYGQVDLFREGPGDLAFAVIQYTVDVPDEGVPAELEIRFDPFFTEVPGRDGLLLLNGGFQAGEFVAAQESLIAYTADNRTQAVNLGGRDSGVTSGPASPWGLITSRLGLTTSCLFSR